MIKINSVGYTNQIKADDVAAYILKKLGSMTTMKLQKLLYYCQAWSLVWEEKPLFPERVEAWANGPILPSIYTKHQGSFEVTKWEEGNDSLLSNNQKEAIDAVLKHYGHQTGQWLSELTHMEEPWKNARKNLKPGERGKEEITHSAMLEYYESLI